MIGNTFAEQVRAVRREHASMTTHLRVRDCGDKKKKRACGALSGHRVDDVGAVTCEACKSSSEARLRPVDREK